MQQSHRVSQSTTGPLVVAPHEAHHHPSLARRRCQPVQHGKVFRDQVWAQQQIARRIAGGGEFGEHHQIRARVRRPAVRVQDLLLVAREVADGAVDLSQRNFHALKLENRRPFRKRLSPPGAGGISCAPLIRWQFRSAGSSFPAR